MFGCLVVCEAAYVASLATHQRCYRDLQSGDAALCCGHVVSGQDNRVACIGCMLRRAAYTTVAKTGNVEL
jgi:hypothetical protein